MQVRITRQQAQTSLDELRLKLFEKRYEIYNRANDSIHYILTRSAEENFSLQDFLPIFTAINESRFFFPERQRSWMRETMSDARRYIGVRARSLESKEFLELHQKLRIHPVGAALLARGRD